MIRFVHLLCLVALSCPVWGQESDAESAEQVVVSYLKELAGEKELQAVLKETVLSPFLSQKRREGVVERLRVLRGNWSSRQIIFRPLQSIIEDDHGVVIVELHDEEDPMAVEVIGLGVHFKKGVWKSAPLPGSFEGVFLGFDEDVEDRVGKLERWMAAENVRWTKERLSQARDDFSKKLAAAEVDALVGDDPKAVVAHFLKTCRARNFMGALACLRKFQEGQDHEWLEIKDILAVGLQGKDARGQWRLLTDSHVLRQIGEVDLSEEKASVQVVFYTVDKPHGVCDLRFDLLQKEDRWELHLPPELRYADYEESKFRGLTRMGRENEGLDLFESFLDLFYQGKKDQNFSDLESASEAVLEQLQAESFAGLFAMLSRDPKMTLKEVSAQFRAAAELWIRFQESDASWEFRRVALEKKERAGLLVFARLDSGMLDWVHLEPLYMIKQEEHWLLAPGVDEPGNFDAGEKEWRAEEKELRQIFRKEDDGYLAKILPTFSEVVAEVDQDSVRWGKADPVKAVEIVREFRGLLKESKMMEALKLAAVIEPGEAIWEGMKSLTYTARGIQQAPEVDVYLSQEGEGPWSRVSVQVSAPADGEPQFLMYLVGPTKSGPRVVIDADLRLATNKGRELLNENKLNGFGKILGNENLQLVTTLFEQHTAEAQKIYEEWQKNNTSSP